MTEFERQAFEPLRQITASLARQELMLKSLNANIERLALLRDERSRADADSLSTHSLDLS